MDMNLDLQLLVPLKIKIGYKETKKMTAGALARYRPSHHYSSGKSKLDLITVDSRCLDHRLT